MSPDKKYTAERSTENCLLCVYVFRILLRGMCLDDQCILISLVLCWIQLYSEEEADLFPLGNIVPNSNKQKVTGTMKKITFSGKGPTEHHHISKYHSKMLTILW